MINIIFKKMTLKENIKVINELYFNDNIEDSNKLMLVEYFPLIEDINVNMLKEDIKKQLEDIVKYYYETYTDNLDRELVNYQKVFNKGTFIKDLEEYFDIRILDITIKLGLIPTISYEHDKNIIYIMPGMIDMELNSYLYLNIYNIFWFNKIKHLIKGEYNYHTRLYNYTNDVKKVILNNKRFIKYHLIDNEYDLELMKIFNKRITLEVKIKLGYQKYQ